MAAVLPDTAKLLLIVIACEMVGDPPPCPPGARREWRGAFIRGSSGSVAQQTIVGGRFPTGVRGAGLRDTPWPWRCLLAMLGSKSKNRDECLSAGETMQISCSSLGRAFRDECHDRAARFVDQPNKP